MSVTGLVMVSAMALESKLEMVSVIQSANT
jgi:hypothetical protein